MSNEQLFLFKSHGLRSQRGLKPNYSICEAVTRYAERYPLGRRSLSEGVHPTKRRKPFRESLYLEIGISNPDSLEKVVDRGILGC